LSVPGDERDFLFCAAHVQVTYRLTIPASEDAMYEKSIKQEAVEQASVTKYEQVKIKEQLPCCRRKEAISAILIITSKHKSGVLFTVAT
jgi:hypothetical protein